MSEIQLANEYLLNGQKDKALIIYESLAKNFSNIPIIHNNYLNLLLETNDFNTATSYLKKVLKNQPTNIQYQLDLGIIYHRSGDEVRADKYFKMLIEENKSHVQTIKMMASYLSARSMESYAIFALTESRDFLGNQYLYTLDLAMLYRILGDKDKMVNEYLNYVTQSAANIQYVKNVMQALLSDAEDLESLERLLYDRVQKRPNVEVYADLLIWVTMQQKNFYGSFIQARAYDKRYNRTGEKCMEVAQVALDNNDYSNAAKIYKYVVDEFPDSHHYLAARLGLIKTRESQIKNIYPVKKDSVRNLIKDYEAFIRSYPNNSYSLEAQRNEALLYAKYLDEVDSAVFLLDDLINNPRATLSLKAKSKLDLGDIYLLNEEPWEATLLYSQVEKMQKESALGYEAKLRNAKYSYYQGDFLLAQEHLDILKEATTREIANDAMELSLRIKENISTDSTGAALKEFAKIELLLYQNKTEESLQRLAAFGQTKEEWISRKEAFIKNYSPLAFIEDHGDSVLIQQAGISQISIMDDVYWLEADIYMKKGDFQQSLICLQKILDHHSQDVLADDAYFLQGDIYERQLKDIEKAMSIYRDFLTKYPGSVFAAEARKRFRTLRGDFKDVN